MNIRELRQQLIEHEGLRNFPYACPAKKLTIGVGRNMSDRGLSLPEIMYLLDNDIIDVVSDLKKIFPDLLTYPETIQLVLADMRFNLGPAGFRSFIRMICAVKARDWPEMRTQMIDSEWFDQVGIRAENLVKLVEAAIDH